jgi:hypothetical protein
MSGEAFEIQKSVTEGALNVRDTFLEWRYREQRNGLHEFPTGEISDTCGHALRDYPLLVPESREGETHIASRLGGAATRRGEGFIRELDRDCFHATTLACLILLGLARLIPAPADEALALARAAQAPGKSKQAHRPVLAEHRLEQGQTAMPGGVRDAAGALN